MGVAVHVVLPFALWLFIAAETNAFTSLPQAGKKWMAMPPLFGEGGSGSSAKEVQEQQMERSSIAGAETVSKMTVEERTKRAMLAEAVEDRIFELVDVLEHMMSKNDGILVGGEKEEALELAKQTKALQIQYDDLVSGNTSSLIDADSNDRTSQ